MYSGFFPVNRGEDNSKLLPDQVLANIERMRPGDIGYVCAHGTATEKGDIAESHATANALGNVPISSLKSYLGHTLGACGSIEAWACINMMHDNWYAPTINLQNVDEQCGHLDYIQNQGRRIKPEQLLNILSVSESQTKSGSTGAYQSGLGLILSREFAKNNGGKLEITSNITEGTIVVLTLPRKRLEQSSSLKPGKISPNE